MDNTNKTDLNKAPQAAAQPAQTVTTPAPNSPATAKAALPAKPSHKINLNQEDFVGKIKTVSGQIVEVDVESSKVPDLGEVLTSDKDTSITLEVYNFSHNSIFCLSLTPTALLHRGMTIYTTNSALTIPVGSKTLGRVMNLFGD